jgi:hypothetical protein
VALPLLKVKPWRSPKAAVLLPVNATGSSCTGWPATTCAAAPPAGFRATRSSRYVRFESQPLWLPVNWAGMAASLARAGGIFNARNTSNPMLSPLPSDDIGRRGARGLVSHRRRHAAQRAAKDPAGVARNQLWRR